MIGEELIDRFGPIIGCNGIAVYNVLARYANKHTRRTFVGLETIASKLATSQPTVSRALQLLITHRLVHRESGKLKGLPTEYILRDIPRVKASDSAPLFDGGGQSPMTDPIQIGKMAIVVSTTYEGEEGGSVTHDLPGQSNRGGGVSQKRVSYKEEPDRSNKNRSKTTTTVVLDSARIRTALLRYVSVVDEDALEKLIARCQLAAPDVTTVEIEHFILEKGEVIMAAPRKRAGEFSTVSSIHNPLGFLLSAVPKCFSGSAFEMWRREQAAAVKAAVAEAKRRQEEEQNAIEWLNQQAQKQAAMGD